MANETTGFKVTIQQGGIPVTVIVPPGQTLQQVFNQLGIRAGQGEAASVETEDGENVDLSRPIDRDLNAMVSPKKGSDGC